jgi:hypothetical protein
MKKKKEEVLDKKDCYRCKWYEDEGGDQGQVLRLKYVGLYDIDTARDILKRKPRKAISFPPDELKIFIGKTYAPHLAHVNTRKAGILGTIEVEGGVEIWMFEGNHRGQRSIDLGRNFRCYHLTAEETKACFIGRRKPKDWVMKFGKK